MKPTDPDGPHGVAVSPDGKHYYVSTGARDAVRPALEVHHRQRHAGWAAVSWGISRDGLGVAGRLLAYVVNFNLHGDMVPSSVSVVATEEMEEVAQASRRAPCRTARG